jgi:hypothetical protein
MGLSTPQPFTAPPSRLPRKILCYDNSHRSVMPFIATKLQTTILYRNPIPVSVSNSSTTSTYRRGEDSAARVPAPKSFHVAMTALEGREKVVAAATMTGRTWRDSSTIIDPLDAENEGKGRTELSGPCRQHF